MRPKLTSAVRRGMESLAARAGSPINTDEARAMAFAKQMGQVKVLNPNRVGGGHKKKKRRQPKQLRR